MLGCAGSSCVCQRVGCIPVSLDTALDRMVGDDSSRSVPVGSSPRKYSWFRHGSDCHLLRASYPCTGSFINTFESREFSVGINLANHSRVCNLCLAELSRVEARVDWRNYRCNARSFQLICIQCVDENVNPSLPTGYLLWLSLVAGYWCTRAHQIAVTIDIVHTPHRWPVLDAIVDRWIGTGRFFATVCPTWANRSAPHR